MGTENQKTCKFKLRIRNVQNVIFSQRHDSLNLTASQTVPAAASPGTPLPAGARQTWREQCPPNLERKLVLGTGTTSILMQAYVLLSMDIIIILSLSLAIAYGCTLVVSFTLSKLTRVH